MNTLLTLSLGCLFGISFFNTLLRSFRNSHEAGLSRLSGKSAAIAKHITRLDTRWLEVTGLITLLGGICQLTTIASTILLLQPLLESDPGMGWGLGFCYGLVNIVMTYTLPVVLAEHYADRVTLVCLPFVSWLHRILFPFALLISSLERALHLHLGSSQDAGNRPSAGDEILTLVEQTRDYELDDEERDFIRSALEFGETITREIMTPRVKMFGLEDTLTVEEAIAAIQDSPYSRFPLFHEDYDEVLGMIHVKDLIQAVAADQGSSPLTALMKPATFVPESMPISDLLRMMKQKKVHTAIAVDEYGGTAGVVTLEDILEELVGEIEDEHDQEQKNFAKIREGVFEVEATMSIDEANEEFGLDLPEEEDYDTIAGYILATLGRIPAAGERIDCARGEIRIKEASPRQIKTLTILPSETSTGG